MNIEEVKKRSANFKEEYLPFFNNNGEMHEWHQMYADNLYLLSIIEQAEKVLTYYAEEPYLTSIGYSNQAINALQAIRGK